MEKDFDSWNIQKKGIENNIKELFFKQGEIRWSAVGVNVGSESCGKGDTFRRPVLIIKKLSKTHCIVIPVSTQIKIGTWYCNYKLHGDTYSALL